MRAINPHIKPKPQRGRHRGSRDMRNFAMEALANHLQDGDSHRVSLAHHLHKDVTGGLVACAAISEMVRQEFDRGGDPDLVHQMLSSLEDTLRQTIRCTRDLTAAEFPPVLKAFGLVSCLQDLIKKISDENCDLFAAISIQGTEPALAQDQRFNLYRILEAMIVSSLQQPHLSQVELVCAFQPKKAEFRIDHNGGNCLLTSGNGTPQVAAIWARTALLGARLQTSSMANGKHRVRLILPLAAVLS